MSIKEKVLTWVTIIALILPMILSACDNNTTNDGYPIRALDTGIWVSPDGVEYWIGTYRLAPRYDSNGNLVIHNKGENSNDIG